MGKVENRRMNRGKHKKVKLVHEVKMEVYSRDDRGISVSTVM